MLIPGMIIERASEAQLKEVKRRGKDLTFETLDQVIVATAFAGRIYIHDVQPLCNQEAMD